MMQIESGLEASYEGRRGWGAERGQVLGLAGHWRMAYNRGVMVSTGGGLTSHTRMCAVVGHPVRHSASPAMQNAGMAALGLDWCYVALEVRPEGLRSAIEGARAMGFIGLNLTVPHKLLAVEMVEVLDESAREWGAVNTIRFEGSDSSGAWRPMGEFLEETPESVRAHGFNTDADAIVLAMAEELGIDPRGARILVLGAGGAGRVAALRLARAGVGRLYLVNRTKSKAEEIAAAIRQKDPGVEVELGYPGGRVDLVLNATSLGLRAGDGLPWDVTAFDLRQADAVYDLIYRPARTRLLERADEAGCRTANGLGMLLHQGTKALELWSGRAAPVEVMRGALKANVYGD
jgi:shikimate dehydrogenase